MRLETKVKLYRFSVDVFSIMAASTTTIKEDVNIGDSIEDSVKKMRGRERRLGFKRLSHYFDSLVLPIIFGGDGVYRIHQSIQNGDYATLGIGAVEVYLGLKLLASTSPGLDIEESRTKATLRELARGKVAEIDTDNGADERNQ